MSFRGCNLRRRRFIAQGGLGVALLIEAACSTPSTPAASPPAAAASAPASAPSAPATASAPSASAIVRGGQLIEAGPNTYPTFAAHVSSTTGIPGYQMLFDYLTRYELVDEAKGQFALKPGLAESWEQPDPKTVVFHLRKGVKFHDNSEWNATVAKWNLNDLTRNPKSFGKAYLRDIDSIDTPDATTLKITLKVPSSTLPSRVSGANAGVMTMYSRAAYEKLGEAQFGRNPVGSGPMSFKQRITDDRLTLVKFPDY